ncbi:multidrug transporter [Bacillus mesophilum]|uniref:Multidrug transporter n=1 Tax=Bacillus mesophilum TaxID=1071718 RepID=A0A7V7RLA9_9BACI|nr:multidrug transporter [Bacillus mesophilum]
MKWSGGHSTPEGSRGKAETPQERAPRRLSFLPSESECPQLRCNGLVARTMTLNV